MIKTEYHIEEVSDEQEHVVVTSRNNSRRHTPTPGTGADRPTERVANNPARGTDCGNNNSNDNVVTVAANNNRPETGRIRSGSGIRVATASTAVVTAIPGGNGLTTSGPSSATRSFW